MLVAAAGLLSATARAEPVTRCDGGSGRDCRFILGVEEELTRMLVTGDPAPLREHLDSRAIWVTKRGEVREGRAFVAAVAGDTRRATATLDRAEVRFFGDTAIVTWSQSWTAPEAAITSGHLAGVDTWAKRKGRWRIVATSEVKAAP